MNTSVCVEHIFYITHLCIFSIVILLQQHTVILTTVNIKKCLSTKSTYIHVVSEGSCDTED